MVQAITMQEELKLIRLIRSGISEAGLASSAAYRLLLPDSPRSEKDRQHILQIAQHSRQAGYSCVAAYVHDTITVALSQNWRSLDLSKLASQKLLQGVCQGAHRTVTGIEQGRAMTAKMAQTHQQVRRASRKHEQGRAASAAGSPKSLEAGIRLVSSLCNAFTEPMYPEVVLALRTVLDPCILLQVELVRDLWRRHDVQFGLGSFCGIGLRQAQRLVTSLPERQAEKLSQFADSLMSCLLHSQQ